jgi:hypothetical protein
MPIDTPGLRSRAASITVADNTALAPASRAAAKYCSAGMGRPGAGLAISGARTGVAPRAVTSAASWSWQICLTTLS